MSISKAIYDLNGWPNLKVTNILILVKTTDIYKLTLLEFLIRLQILLIIIKGKIFSELHLILLIRAPDII